MGRLKNLLSLSFLGLGLTLADPTWAANAHWVGWFNTVIPGGGEFWLGDYGHGALQTVLEGGTFAAGYLRSHRTPLTLDGVPEDLPRPSNTLVVRQRTTCRFEHSQNRTVCTSTTRLRPEATAEQDISGQLMALWAQEFGLKYHMVNVFNAYRKAAGEDRTIGEQSIDDTSTKDLFAAPFRWENLKDPWVYGGLLGTAAVLAYSFRNLDREHQFQPLAPINRKSRILYHLTYLGMYPMGSAAPEEMFYRGFLQHEMYGLVQSPFFSIGMSTLAYTFSHSAQDRPSAALTGALLGFLAYRNRGRLSKGIAYHFWANVLAGLYEISVFRRELGQRPLFSLKFEF